MEYDSRRVQPGYVFVAMKGETTDGNRYIDAAVEKGAVAIVSDSPQIEPQGELAWARVEHGRRALARLSANFYKRPAERLTLSGITGTNGKSTTAYLLESVLSAARRKTALLGTIEYHIGANAVPSPHTTPEALELNRFLAQAVGEGVTEAVMEVSSHALAQQRVFGIPYDVAVFTNLTRDHLDYHHTIEEYFQAKQMLFAGVGTEPPRAAVINLDDPHGAELLRYAKSRSSVVLTYGWDAGDFSARNVDIGLHGTRFDLTTPGGVVPLFSPMIGKVNVYNIAAACAAAYARGVGTEAMAAGIGNLARVPGRFERVDCGQPFTVVVDYAHTDDALRNLTSVAREFVSHSGAKGRVITLFGCGGDRDRAKRPLMAEAVGSGSDFVVLTSDNPRSEDPGAIIADALPGLKQSGVRYVVEPDRRKAIALAIAEARPGDMVLLAGKGHEKVQITADGEVPFDETQVAVETLHAAGYNGPKNAAPSTRLAPDLGVRSMKLSLGRIAEFIDAGALAPARFDPHAVAAGYSIDSRTVRPGELFFAVKGERLDGHDFVEAALATGALAAVVSRDQAPRYADRKKLLLVDDPLAALQTLGMAVRKLWAALPVTPGDPGCGPRPRRLIAITGSAGKTTTKEALATVLSVQFNVLKSEGNLNNHFGLPMQLLRLECEHELAVVELGMSHAGEIAALARIALPDMGVVTCVAPVHLGYFESVAEIARAKYELIQGLPPSGTAVLNADDPYVSQFGRDFPGKVVTFAVHHPADMRAENIHHNGAEGSTFEIVAGDSSVPSRLPLLGEHNIYNALAAIAVALSAESPGICCCGLAFLDRRPTSAARYCN